MNRHKKLIIALFGLVALALVVLSVSAISARDPLLPPSAQAAPGGAAPPAAGPGWGATAQEAAEPPLPVVVSSADFAVVYKSVSQLREAAEVIVRGEVTAVSYLDFNASTYTKVTFQVTRCLKGAIAPGEEITIAEVGGITTMAQINGDKFGAPSPADADTKVRVQLEGAPLAAVGDRCLYFLGVGSIGVVPGPYYVPLGAFQGRFRIESGLATRFVPADWQDGGYTELPLAESGLDQVVEQAAE